ncbi:hypothetical protein GCM10020366_08700 [Saccharopolyspora gregorii]|uniref:Uncharacterized protein n=1 Tax=Saccharopolyspora gregorii TaxID=33914 RepID=A0ABP6RI26_9PSEU
MFGVAVGGDQHAEHQPVVDDDLFDVDDVHPVRGEGGEQHGGDPGLSCPVTVISTVVGFGVLTAAGTPFRSGTRETPADLGSAGLVLRADSPWHSGAVRR